MYKLCRQNYPVNKEKERAKYISISAGIPLDIIYSKSRNYVSNWYEIDDKWYFYKGEVSPFYMINELLGEEISKYFDLESVHYHLASREGQCGLLSENFINKKYKYKKPSEYGITKQVNLTILEKIKTMCKSEEEYLTLSNQIKSFLIRDLYTSQKDRTNNNLLFKEKETISLAPLFDYEYSFSKRDIGLYRGVLGTIILDKDTKIKLHKDREFNKNLCLLIDIDILKIINKIEEKHKITIDSEEKKYYVEYDSKVKKLLF